MTDSRDRRTSDLHALRDSEPVAALRQALNALPDVQPDPVVWDRIRARSIAAGADVSVVEVPAGPVAAVTPIRTRTGFRAPRVPHAMAAGLLLAAAAGLVGVNAIRSPAPADQPGSLAGVAPVEADEAMLRGLYERSRRLERFLLSERMLPEDASVRAVRYRLADLDVQLADYPDGSVSSGEAQQLVGRRVALLESLAEVRRARASVQLAVY